MARRTVDVKWLTDRVNTVLATPDSTLYMKAPGKDRDMTPEEAFRAGALSVLESVLHATGNYRGFGYQEGVVPSLGGEFGDETRRVYYYREAGK
jgi:hypothetical protein